MMSHEALLAIQYGYIRKNRMSLAYELSASRNELAPGDVQSEHKQEIRYIEPFVGEFNPDEWVKMD